MAITRNTTQKVETFYRLLAECGSINEACKGAGISRTYIYTLMNKDETVLEKIAEAKAEAVEALELVARRRAVEKSDLLLIFLLKALKPEVYRERYNAPSAAAYTDYVIDLSPPEGFDLSMPN